MVKNIVILSDGTGNAASSGTPTNVWRLYEALDLSNPAEQVAFYDDGVGTERWKPRRLLGGALGFGLKRNVLEMYEFLSRTYDPGDRVFVFGFSRGAYTVRVLVGLVHRCGLVKNPRSEVSLHKAAKANYKKFREKFALAPTRWLGWRAERRAPTPPADDTRIAFLGVWDTVDAYGLPIDEMASAWDRFIYPYRFTDRTLSSIVGRAAHAVALDDERHTFHPVLWDESGEKCAVDAMDEGGAGGSEERERIRQVWFAGAHANVGGGYPDDTLAHVPLDWMLSETENAAGVSPLIFLPKVRESLALRAEVDGKLYNSRSGLQTYYRFKPRKVSEICDDRMNNVKARVRIHESVFERIGDSAIPYAPFGLPEHYETIPARRGGSAPVVETAAGRGQRVEATEDVWDLVHWRRWLYVTLVLATLVLAASPILISPIDEWKCPDDARPCVAASLVDLVSPLLPNWSTTWQKVLGQNPALFFILVGIVAVQFVLSRWLRGRVGREAAAAWRLSLGTGAAPPAHGEIRAILRKVTRRLRTLCTGRCAAIRNAILAILALVFMIGAAVYVIYELSQAVADAFS